MEKAFKHKFETIKRSYENIQKPEERNEKLRIWTLVYDAYDRTPDIMQRLS